MIEIRIQNYSESERGKNKHETLTSFSFEVEEFFPDWNDDSIREAEKELYEVFKPYEKIDFEEER